MYLLCFVMFRVCIFIFVLSVLVQGLLPSSDNTTAVNNNNNNNNNRYGNTCRQKCCAKGSVKEIKIQEFKYRETMNVEPEMYNCTSYNWSHWNSTEKLKGKF